LHAVVFFIMTRGPGPQMLLPTQRSWFGPTWGKAEQTFMHLLAFQEKVERL